MTRSDSKQGFRTKLFDAKGAEASRLRRRKYTLVREFDLPEQLLGGSLVLSHRRCGKSTCHCAQGDGHPQWTLTYSMDGAKRSENIPAGLVEVLVPLVDAGRAYRHAIGELRSINAQLFSLWQQEQRAKKTQLKQDSRSKRHSRRKRR